jgi:hypothetical protein
MKKMILLAVVAAAITTTGCRKERTCECKTTETVVTTGYGEGTLTYNYSSSTTKAKQKKKEFKTSVIVNNNVGCHSNKVINTYHGGSGIFAYTDVTTTETTCELK